MFKKFSLLLALFVIPFIFVFGQEREVFIDIKVGTSTQNLSDGPLYLNQGSRIYLKWSGKANFCYALGNWRGVRQPNGQTSYTLYREGKYIYALFCASLPKNLQPILGQISGGFNFEDFIAFDYVEVYVRSRVSTPRVDLKINNSDGPITISRPTKIYLTWRTDYNPRFFEASCRGSGANWERQNLSPRGSENFLFDLPQGEYTYTFTCDFNPKCLAPEICPETSARSVSDSVKVISRISATPPTSRVQVDVKVYDPQTRNFTDDPITLNVGEQTRVKWTSAGYMYNRVSCSKFGDWSGNVSPNGEEVFTVREAKEYRLGIRCEFSYKCEAQICPQIYLPDVSAEDSIVIRGVGEKRSNIILTIDPQPINNKVVLREDQPLYISLENSTFLGKGRLYVGYVDPFGFPILTFYHSSSTNPKNLKVENLYFVKEQTKYFPDIFINTDDILLSATPTTIYGGPQIRLRIDLVEVPKGPELVKNNSFVNGLNDWEKQQPVGSQIEIKTYSYNQGDDNKTLYIKGNGKPERTRVIQWVPIENNSYYFITIYGSYSKDPLQGNRSVISADEWCLGGARGNTFIKTVLNFESRPGSGSNSLYSHAPLSNYFKSESCDPDQDHRLAIFFDAFYNTQIEIAQVSLKKHLRNIALKKVTFSSPVKLGEEFQISIDASFLNQFINQGILEKDCNNLRVVYDPRKVTSDLPYYIEGKCGENGSKIWIKIPHNAFPNLPRTFYLVAVPDPSARSESNPYSTFTFYEDFESSLKIGKELEFRTCTDGKYEIKDGVLILKPGTDNKGRPYMLIYKEITNGVKHFNFEEGVDYFIEYRAKTDMYPYGQIIFIFDWDGLIGGEWCGILNGGTAIEWGEVGKRIEVYENGNQEIISTSTASDTTDWNIYKIGLNYYFNRNANATYYNVVYQKNNEKELRATYKSSGYRNIGISGREQLWSWNTYFDWIRIRKEIPGEIKIENADLGK